MPKAQLYFLSDQYYLDFPDDKLMKNKDMIDGVPHNRPCFFAFSVSQSPDICWIVPISSKVEKYKKIEQDKIKRYGKCNTVRFGTVLGRNTALRSECISYGKEGLEGYFPRCFQHLPGS